MKITTQEQRDKIEKILTLELVKRGINAVLFTKEDNEKIRISSTKFQTSPVLFEEISIVDFGSWIIKKEKYIEVIITVNAWYKHFDGGNNSCTLFTATIRCFGESVKLVNVV